MYSCITLYKYNMLKNLSEFEAYIYDLEDYFVSKIDHFVSDFKFLNSS